VIWWNGFAFAGDFFKRHGFRAVAARGHHYSENAFVNQIGACAAQPRGEQTIRRNGAITGASAAVAEFGPDKSSPDQ
jgi:hypothetical protein